MNFLRNAKQVLDTAQTLSKEVSNAYAQHQQQQQTTETQSSSKSKCSDLKKEEQNFKHVDCKKLTRLDNNENCFSVMQDAESFYHVVYVPASLSILKIGDKGKAESQRNLLSKHTLLANSAYHHKLLSKFVTETNDHKSWDSIHLACLLGLEDAVNKLCEKDALLTVNLATPDNGSLPLHICIKQSNLPLTKRLLSYGADLRKCELSTCNCLHYAVEHGYAFVKALHDAKSDQFKEALDSANNDDFTPFHYSLKSESPQLVNFLLECGANSSLIGVDIVGLNASIPALNALLQKNPNAMTGNPIRPYSTVFHGEFDRRYLKAAHRWCPKIVNHPNEDGRTPLHSACARNDLERAVDLLSFGADVNLTGKLGNTPLHLAVSKNNEALVKILLCFNADYTIKNNDGKTPMDINSTAAIAKILHQLITSKKNAESTEAGNDLPNLIRSKQNKTVKYQESLDYNVRGKSLRLLALDGGGIRGLSLALLLLRIERETQSKNIVDYFDWIAGTSTGAILALSLAEGYPTIDCLRFYLRLKDEVFVGNRPHDAGPLEDFLRECFGEKTMNEVKNNKRVLVTTTKSDTNPPKLVLLRNYEMPDIVTLAIPPKQVKIWKAARCSSAAPTYFSSVDKMYLDGGLVANNPAPDLLSDVHYYNLQRENEGNEPLSIACLLSLGTGRVADQPINSIDLEVPKTSGIGSILSTITTSFTTLKNLANVFMEQLATSDGAVVERSRTWAHSIDVPYFRFTPILEKECLLNTRENSEVIDLMWTAKLYAESRSTEEIQQIIQLIRAN